MTSPIDPIRRASEPRRTRKSGVDRREETQATSANLPVPIDFEVEEPEPTPHVATPPPVGHTVFHAHMIGQDGQKRGLRGGPPVLDMAKATYTRTEWSGQADRRSARGGSTKTEA